MPPSPRGENSRNPGRPSNDRQSAACRFDPLESVRMARRDPCLSLDRHGRKRVSDVGSLRPLESSARGDVSRTEVSCSGLLYALVRPPSEVRFRKAAAALSLISIRSAGIPVSRESSSTDFPLRCSSSSSSAKGVSCRSCLIFVPCHPRWSIWRASGIVRTRHLSRYVSTECTGATVPEESRRCRAWASTPRGTDADPSQGADYLPISRSPTIASRSPSALISRSALRCLCFIPCRVPKTKV